MNVARLIVRGLFTAALIALFFMPMNMISSLFWFAGFAIFVSAIVALVRELRGARAFAPIAVALAGIALFPLACGNLSRAMIGASSEAKALARTVQMTCTKDRRCPKPEQVCTVHDDGDTCRMGGSLGVQYPIHYSLDDVNKRLTFRITFNANMDDSTTIKGGVSVPLTEHRYVEGIDMNAPADAGSMAP